MATFFTADTHFGDRHILRHRATRFASLEAHDEDLVARWNEVVSDTDEVWHLGDFASDATPARCREIFARLRGSKHLVRGNHETNRVLDLPWRMVAESARITVSDAGIDARFFLSHYAHRAWPGLWRGVRHLYGHTHGALADTRRSCDVGVDVWDNRPVGVAAILARQDAAAALPEEMMQATPP